MEKSKSFHNELLHGESGEKSFNQEAFSFFIGGQAHLEKRKDESRFQDRKVNVIKAHSRFRTRVLGLSETVLPKNTEHLGCDYDGDTTEIDWFADQPPQFYSCYEVKYGISRFAKHLERVTPKKQKPRCRFIERPTKPSNQTQADDLIKAIQKRKGHPGFSKIDKNRFRKAIEKTYINRYGIDKTKFIDVDSVVDLLIDYIRDNGTWMMINITIRALLNIPPLKNYCALQDRRLRHHRKQ